jgi:hypothetical protein
MLAANDCLNLADTKVAFLTPRCASRCTGTGPLLASGCEIALHFTRLLRPVERPDAFDHLIQIACTQRFVVSANYFTILIALLRRSKGRACELLHQISLFPNYFVTHLTNAHLLALRRDLPDTEIFRILSQFVARSLRFATVVASDGFEPIIARMQQTDVPSFVGFLATFSDFTQFNGMTIPLFQAWVLPGIVSSDLTLAIASLSALRRAVRNSTEMLELTAGDPRVHQAFEGGGHDVGLVKALLKLVLAVIKSGDDTLAGSNGFCNFLCDAFEADGGCCSEIGFRILAEIQGRGHGALLAARDFPAIAFAAMGSDAAYEVKKWAMIVLCIGFSTATRTETDRYVERGIVEVISLAIGCTDHDLHGAAAAALADLGALGELTGDTELVLMAMDAQHVGEPETPDEI